MLTKDQKREVIRFIHSTHPALLLELSDEDLEVLWEMKEQGQDVIAALFDGSSD